MCKKKIPYVGGFGTDYFELPGLLQVQEQVQVTVVETKSVDGRAKQLNLALWEPPKHSVSRQEVRLRVFQS